jgi:hypothetical protein
MNGIVGRLRRIKGRDGWKGRERYIIEIHRRDNKKIEEAMSVKPLPDNVESESEATDALDSRRTEIDELDGKPIAIMLMKLKHSKDLELEWGEPWPGLVAAASER